MASTICGWCGKATHMTVRVALVVLPKGNNESDEGAYTQAAYCCDNCDRFSVAWSSGRARHTTDPTAVDDYLSGTEGTVHWVPRTGETVTFADVPKHIASAASEAHEAASIGAKRASILMARSVIEASAKAHGIERGTLYTKIEELAKKGIVRPLIADAAHGIRDFGNDMAHGDFETDVTQQDVEETLDLMAVVLSEVFQVDAKTRALRERYAARKSTPTDGNAAPEGEPSA